MAWVIQVVGMPDGRATPHDGRYVKLCDFDAPYGVLALDSVEHAKDALLFPTSAEALAYWRTTSRRQPLRPDGEPNRPLTGVTVSVENV